MNASTPSSARARFQRRLSIALGLSVRAGVSWEKAAPPGARWMWRRGVRVPPAHLMPFWWNMIILGALWGVPMIAFFVVQNLVMYGTVRWLLAVGASTGGAVVFGVIMAAILRGVRRRHGLPMWRNIDAGQTGVDPGLCVRCGYDFTGAAGLRCPECGWMAGD